MGLDMKSKLHETSIIVASALLATLDASGAWAAGRSTSLKVSLTVQDTCTVVAATPAADSASNDLTVHCRGRTAPYVLQDGDLEPQFGKAVRMLAGENDPPGARYVLRRGTALVRTPVADPAPRSSAEKPGDPHPDVVPTTVVF
jgi:hypothetical protein